ncbi:preprotein translocase subunit SecE [Aquibacillus rhizosphaerae]|uniref:Protein translocase subunit SecE n=1 Tax=Aquibacillus rhizosphaerae TaxID=3051431 RepID=A0ABT7L7L2_9BACI|nr:preprotein translocase subunit SecE [Aquibacillus sp. LR5S19]MDL4841369.1 preprotein translocase subunit SecE [Aquibacillus sp. LR5S19]
MFAFFKNVSREMKKVSWPGGRELTRYTITVVATVAFVSVFFGVVDQGITAILNLLFE